MKINTNYSTTPSPISFNARFKTEIPIKDVQRLRNIQTMFINETQKYTDDTLTLTMSKSSLYPNIPVITSSSKTTGGIPYSHLFDNLNELLSSKSDTNIVKKLVNYLKMIKAEEKYDNLLGNMDKDISKLEKEILNSNNKVKLTQELCELKEKREQLATSIVKEMQEIAEEEYSLAHVPNIYMD